MRISCILLATIFLAGSLAAALAQEIELKKAQPENIGVINDVDVTVTSLTEEKLNHPPKREIKVEKLDEPMKSKLPRADPKLLVEKFAATFRLATPESAYQHAEVLNSRGEIGRVQFIGEHRLIAPQASRSSGLGGGPSRQSESLRKMIQFLPEGNPIAKAELEFFADAQTMAGLVTMVPFVNEKESMSRSWRLIVLGASPEEAERRATALITLLDLGAFRPIQLELFKTRQLMCANLQQERQKLSSTEKAVFAVQNELKAYADFTAEMLPDLRVQQLQLDVDLAGVKARIATCEKLLSQPSMKPERRNQIEDLKVAAEIEYSGFEARRAKSQEFISKVKMKIELQTKLSKPDFERKVAMDEINNYEANIKNMDAAIRAWTPLPLVDNKMTIQPLEWTQ